MSDHDLLHSRYEEIAGSLDYNTTASDYLLRELEIETALEYMRDCDTVLDVGCGLGYAASMYALRSGATVYGIDYASNMVAGAEKLLQKNHSQLVGKVHFQHASVLELPFPDQTFDVVTSSRCLMALLEWDKQKAALKELHRVLKPGGVLVLMEGTVEGLDRLNDMREKFELEPIAADGRDRLITRKFIEEELTAFCAPYYALERVKRFGMYYFLTRVVQPLMVAPAAPSYDHPINKVARMIAQVIPDFDGLGHLVAFIFNKRR